jgi:SSS family solute:Na+ symporter
MATGIYTISGGLAPVIYTDLFQTFVLIAGAAVLAITGLDKVGASLDFAPRFHWISFI